MDYQSMWEELKKLLQTEKSKWMNDVDDETDILNGIKISLSLVEYIERKYAPKEYSWDEIITMEPLPEEIKSSLGMIYFYDDDSKTYNDCNYDCTNYPSIQEMKNLWTIIK